MDVQFSSSISIDDAAEIGKSYLCKEDLHYQLDWACVDSIQRNNFGLLVADVEANLLCKGVKALSLLLNVQVGM